jgi:hypothetical protein
MTARSQATDRRARALGLAAGLLGCAVLGASGVAGASESLPPAGSPSFSWGVLAGSTQPVARFADYQWSVAPHAGWGTQGLVEFGSWSTGARVWQTHTAQTLDASDPNARADARTTTVELVGRRVLTNVLGMSVHATANGGWLHLGYHPEHVTLQSGGMGGAVAVTLAPVNTWTGGAGLAFGRPLAGPPTRRLARIVVEQHGSDLVATGIEV